MNTKKIVAILCSDIHLSHRPPIARSAEPDWYEAMARPLRELRELRETDDGPVPVVCAGDVFDRWNSPPELVNFALRELPEMHAIPGQHDMPNHDYGEMGRSAYRTLVEAGKIRDMVPRCNGGPSGGYRLDVHGSGWMFPFPWGCELQSPNEREDDIRMAVVHSFCWFKDACYPGGDISCSRVDNFARRRLRGYDVALIGDNHKGFLWRGRETMIFNAGTLVRRTMAEWDYRPMVGLLRKDGSVEKHFLDTSQDKFLPDPVVEEAEQTLLHLEDFLVGLKSLERSSLHFEKAVESALDECGAGKPVRRIILQAMEKEEN